MSLGAAVRRIRTHASTGGEDGVSMIELMVSAAITLVVLVTVFLTSSATLGSQESALEMGNTTGPTLLAANAVEQIVTNAFVPNGKSSVTSDCTDGSGNSLSGTNGPFVNVADTGSSTLYICSLPPGQSHPYTYEITFSTCSSTSCLLIEKVPAVTGNPSVVESFSGLSNTGTTPFTYYTDNPWGSLVPSAANLSSINAIQIYLTTPTSHGTAKATTASRYVEMPNTLGGFP